MSPESKVALAPKFYHVMWDSIGEDDSFTVGPRCGLCAWAVSSFPENGVPQFMCGILSESGMARLSASADHACWFCRHPKCIAFPSGRTFGD